jgi:hypothetical protein
MPPLKIYGGRSLRDKEQSPWFTDGLRRVCLRQEYRQAEGVIVIAASTRMKCSMAELKSCLVRLDEIYPRYSPEEHLRCDYVRGDPLHEGSVLYFEERVAGKVTRLRYRVASVEEGADSMRAVLRAMFPRSLLNIRAVFSIRQDPEGVVFSRTITAGFENPFLRAPVDALIRRLLGREYVEEMTVHAQQDIVQLAAYIERNLPGLVSRNGTSGCLH